ncbi:MAG: Holliday junction branch migration DNA helicase RuvB [bacterium]
MNKQRVVQKEELSSDTNLEKKLRPEFLSEYIGQERIVDNMKIYIRAAKKDNRQLDHMLLAGPPGLGKTTLSSVAANEMGANITVTSGPAIEKKGDLAGLLTNLKEHDVLFIDEIHRLNASVEESLYSAMEDFFFDIVLGEGPHARSMRLPLQPFTLVGATTRTGTLSSPLRSRFHIIFRMKYYSFSELFQIINRSSEIFGIKIDHEGAMEIAKRSRGTPRIANRLLRRVRDFAEIKGDGHIDKKIADYALEQMEIDSDGLDSMDISILRTILDIYGGGPVGVDAVAAAVSEEKRTLEEVYEPFLITQGFLARTPKGRVVTSKTYKKFNIPEGNTQGRIF